MTEHLIAKLREYKNEMDYQNIDFKKDVVTIYSYDSEWLNGFLTVLFNLRSLLAALLKSKKNGRWVA